MPINYGKKIKHTVGHHKKYRSTVREGVQSKLLESIHENASSNQKQEKRKVGWIINSTHPIPFSIWDYKKMQSLRSLLKSKFWHLEPIKDVEFSQSNISAVLV